MLVDRLSSPSPAANATERADMDVDVERVPSPGSDSDDAYNTSTAKVYFGPLLSPERKFAQIFNPQTPHTPATDTEVGSPALQQLPAALSPQDVPAEPLQDNNDKHEGDSDDERDTPQDREGTPMITILRQDGMF